MKPQYTPGNEVIYCPSGIGNAVVTTVADVERYQFEGENQTFPSYKYHLASGDVALTFELVSHGTVHLDARNLYYLMQGWYEDVTVSNIHFSLEYDPVNFRLYEVPHDENIPPREFMVSAYDVVNMTSYEYEVKLKDKEEKSR